MKRYSQLVVLIAIAMSVAACGESTDDSAALRQALQSELDATAVSLADAACDALDAAGEGAVFLEAEYELEEDDDDDPARYEVSLLVDGFEREFYVDPQTGDVTEDVDDSEEADADDTPTITLDCDGIKDALAAAEAETGGTAFEIELEDVIEVETVENADVWEVELDAELTVLSSEFDETWDGSDDDDDDLDDDDDDDDDLDDDDDDDELDDDA
jgi:uncharacterized membrane protein YkoI